MPDTPTATPTDPTAIEAEIGRQLRAARAALQAAGRLARQLEQAAQAVAAQATASAGPRVIKVRSKRPIDPDGRPIRRPVGRPKGATSNTLTLSGRPPPRSRRYGPSWRSREPP